MTFDLSALGGVRIGLGLAALGRPGYINLRHADDLNRDYDVDRMRARAHEVLDAAWDAGVRYFDAARSYGRAEEFLGSWLRRRAIASKDVLVGSKWGYAYTAGWSVVAERHEVKEHSLAVLRRQLGESRELLGEHLDLYQIHSATPESGVLSNREVLEELARLRDSGIAVGVSVSGPRQAEMILRAMEIEIGGARLFDAIQATWNLLERSAGRALRQAHTAGVRVLVKEALANGRLTDRNHDTSFAASRECIKAVTRRVGCTIDALSLAAVLMQPWASVVLSGAATQVQLESNLGAQKIEWDDSFDDELSSVSESAEEYWHRRSLLAWN